MSKCLRPYNIRYQEHTESEPKGQYKALWIITWSPSSRGQGHQGCHLRLPLKVF